MKRLTIRTAILALLLTLLGCGHKSGNTKPADVDYYTCTMHPSVHVEALGKCPICGMELVPVLKKSPASVAKDNSGHDGMSGMPGMSMGDAKPSGNPSEFVVPVERQQQIGVTYSPLTGGRAPHDPRRRNGGTGYAAEMGFRGARRWLRAAVIRHVTGRNRRKRRAVNFEYSPDLVTTARELVMLLRMRDEANTPETRRGPERLIAAAKSRLQQWNVTEKQIAILERDRTPEEVLTLRSPFAGWCRKSPRAREWVSKSEIAWSMLRICRSSGSGRSFTRMNSPCSARPEHASNKEVLSGRKV